MATSDSALEPRIPSMMIWKMLQKVYILKLWDPITNLWNKHGTSIILAAVNYYHNIYLERSSRTDVDLCRMPHWTMVVLGRPDFGGSVVLEQVDVECHGSCRTEHMVPEFQADWTIIIAR